MKKILLSLFTLAVFGISANVNAQCSVTDAAVTITNQTSIDATHCQVTFSLSFKLEYNGGNKTVVIQAWLDADYPNYWNCGSTHAQTGSHGAPKAADLKKNGTGPLPFLFLAFNNDVTPPVALTSYGPDGSISSSMTTGYTITRGAVDANGFQLFTLSGITVIAPIPCGTGATIRADLWSTQGSLTSQWQPHCVNCNNVYSFGYPEVTGDILCALDPVTGKRVYHIHVANTNTDQSITFSWQTFFDDSPLGGSRGSEDTRLVDDESANVHTLLPGTFFDSTIKYSFGSGDINRPLWIVVTTQGLANTTNKRITLGSGCAFLPASFKSFTATRNNRTNVFVKWETITEQNAEGFAVERNINGSWEQIAFIPSQAQGGNSNSLLTYQLNDLNAAKGISQYRIRQVDLDGLAKLSDIRSVRGEGQKGSTIVYPNPSSDGKVNVVFQGEIAKRNITVQDMSGRTIKEWRNYTNNNIQIENLTPGFYTIRIVNIETGEQDVEKAVVNKR